MKLPRLFKIAIIACLFWRCQPVEDVTPDFTASAEPPLRTESLPVEPYECPDPHCWCHTADD